MEFIGYDISAYDKLFKNFVCLDMNFQTYEEAKEYAFILFGSEMPTPAKFKINGIVDDKNLKTISMFKSYKRHGRVYIKQIN